MSKVWLASLMLCGVGLVGCQSGDKSAACSCDTEVKQEAGAYDAASKEEGKEEVIPADKVPAVVMNAFKKAFADAKIEKIEKETYPDGTVHYEFEYKGKDGKEHEVELNSDGDVLEDH